MDDNAAPCRSQQPGLPNNVRSAEAIDERTITPRGEESWRPQGGRSCGTGAGKGPGNQQNRKPEDVKNGPRGVGGREDVSPPLRHIANLLGKKSKEKRKEA